MKAKKWLAFIVTAVLALSVAVGVAACGPTDPNNPNPGPSGDTDLPESAYSDWYLLGAGSGTLREGTWSYFLRDFRLLKTDEEGKYVLRDITLREGDDFKFMKKMDTDKDGDFFGTQEEMEEKEWWTVHLTAGSADLADKTGALGEGTLGNVLVGKGGDGIYDLYIVEESGGMTYEIQYECKQTLPPLTEAEKYECYLVGDLANYPDNCWPDDVKDKDSPFYGKKLSECCIKLTLQDDGETFATEPLRLTAADRFKVYNVVNTKYHPDGVKNDQKVDRDGMYIIKWNINGDKLEMEAVSGS